MEGADLQIHERTSCPLPASNSRKLKPQRSQERQYTWYHDPSLIAKKLRSRKGNISERTETNQDDMLTDLPSSSTEINRGKRIEKQEPHNNDVDDHIEPPQVRDEGGLATLDTYQSQELLVRDYLISAAEGMRTICAYLPDSQSKLGPVVGHNTHQYGLCCWSMLINLRAYNTSTHNEDFVYRRISAVEGRKVFGKLNGKVRWLLIGWRNKRSNSLP